MGFDFFTQGRGPEIDVTLFPRARESGARTGNMIKTPVQAAIEGLTEGVKTGLDLSQEYQQNVIRQNTIEQLPVTNQIQENEARRGAAAADITESQAYIASQTEAVRLEATKAELSKQVSDVNAIKAKQDTENAFLTSYGNATTPQEKIKILGDPRFTGLFADKPDLFKNAITNPSVYPYLTDQERQAADVNYRRASSNKFYEQEAEKRRQAFIDSGVAVNADPLTNVLHDKLDTAPENYPDSVEFVPHGQYLSTNGQIDLDKRRGGSRILNPKYDAAASNERYDVLDKTGKIVATDATEKSRQAYLKYLKEKAYQDGTFKAKAAQNIQPATKAPQSGAAEREKTFQAGAQGNPNISIKEEFDPVRYNFQKSLNLNEQGLKEIEPQISRIKADINKYLAFPGSRASADALAGMNDTVTNIARTVSENEYNTDPEIRKLYTAKEVREYNKSLDEATASNPFSHYADPNVVADITAAYRIDTPQDLYYVRRRELLESQMNQALSKILATEYSYKTQALRSQAATKSNNSLFIKAANGGVDPTR